MEIIGAYSKGNRFDHVTTTWLKDTQGRLFKHLIFERRKRREAQTVRTEQVIIYEREEGIGDDYDDGVNSVSPLDSARFQGAPGLEYHGIGGIPCNERAAQFYSEEERQTLADIRQGIAELAV